MNALRVWGGGIYEQVYFTLFFLNKRMNFIIFATRKEFLFGKILCFLALVILPIRNSFKT